MKKKTNEEKFNVVTINGVIERTLMDREGSWRVTFECPSSERENIKELSKYTETALVIQIIVPKDGSTFGGGELIEG